MKRTIILASISVLCLLQTGWGQVPRTISYQGVLKDAGGNPVNDSKAITFRLYDVETDGTALWSEPQSVVVSQGVFSVILGETDPLPDSFPAPAWLGIDIDGSELSPRTPLTAAPYAIIARNNWSLTGNSGTTAGTNFLGTSDDMALELHVNGARALRLEPTAEGPNVIGGYSGNSVTSGVLGATIGGGGTSGSINSVMANYTTVSGGANNTASGDYATVPGGHRNTASAPYSTVSGGIDNTASDGFATVGGGQQNSASSDYATLGGGVGNTASGSYATVGGGQNNTASGNITTIGGGEDNIASAYGGTVGGGEGNSASTDAGVGDYSTVGGGQNNTASGDRSIVGGGWNNIADKSYATVGGGVGNAASGDYATVGGGENNTVSYNYATIGGGSNNTASGDMATIGGGYNNTASNTRATVGGGYINIASGSYATVPGGYLNEAAAIYSFAAGNRAKANHNGAFVWADSTNADFASTAANEFAVRATGGFRFLTSVDGSGLRLEPNATSPNVIGGYSGNTVTSGVVGATIGGGGADLNTNRVIDNYCTVAGGQNNQAGDNPGVTDDFPYATVGGGEGNTASSAWSTVGGGQINTASGASSTIGGGWSNTASGGASTVGGGHDNNASGGNATVGGGQVNTASGSSAFVGGGYNNIASGSNATVGGGGGNTANNWATVPGGYNNSASGIFGFAAGRRAKANHTATFVWADFSVEADFASTADNQFLIRAAGGVGIGTDSPSAELDVAGDVNVSGTLTVGGNPVVSPPIGSVTAWLKSFPNTPALSDGWMECNGQVLNDASSPYNGQTIPSLNGTTEDTKKFLRGAATSGGAASTYQHSHTTSVEHAAGDGGVNAWSYPEACNNTSHIPPYYEVVWVMRVK